MSDPFDPAAAIDDYLDGELNAKTQARLRQWMEQNPEKAAQMLTERAALHSRLHLMHQYGGETRKTPRPANMPGGGAQGLPFQKVIGYVRSPGPFSLTVAALVIGLLLCVLALSVPPIYRSMTRGGNPPESFATHFVAQLGATHNPVWAQQKLSSGAHLTAGQKISLTEGLAEIRYRNGAKVLLEGPVSFTLGEAILPDETSPLPWGALGSLGQGKLTADLEGAPVGLGVETPWGAVLHRGTEYGVFLAQDRITEIEVFSGTVELLRSASGESIKRLEQGEKALVSLGGELLDERPRKTTFVHGKAFRRLMEQKKETLADWLFLEKEAAPSRAQGDLVRDLSGRGNHLDWYSSAARYHTVDAEPGSPSRAFDAGSSLADSILFLKGSVGPSFVDHEPKVFRQFSRGEFTLECAFRTESSGRGDVLVYGNRFALFVEKGKVCFQAGNAIAVVGQTGQFNDGRWHFAAASCRPAGNNQHVLTLRAASSDSGAWRTTTTAAGPLAIANRNLAVGGDKYLTNYLFDGLIGQVRISAAELAEEDLLFQP